MKNCLYVGSFNPITKAHLSIANDLLKNKLVDFLYFLPVNSSKENLIAIDDRIKMINLVLTNKQDILNIYEYSINGLFNYQILKKISNITHIAIGADLLLKFKSFKNYKDILNEYYLIVIIRDSLNVKKIIKDNYLEFKDKMIIVNNNYPGSSSVARNNLDNKYLDNKVLDYIKNNNLYN